MTDLNPLSEENRCGAMSIHHGHLGPCTRPTDHLDQGRIHGASGHAWGYVDLAKHEDRVIRAKAGAR